MHKLLFSLLLFTPILCFSQEARYEQLKTFPINLKVLNPLMGTNNMAIMKVEKVEPNTVNLSIGDTILCKFYFTLKPVQGEVHMSGINRGDYISTHMHAQLNPYSGAYQYEAFHYKKYPAKN
tara:strand:- start:74888 stop:75253 length:366 start_codon:yes stop_codon:yes gene_type:complete